MKLIDAISLRFWYLILKLFRQCICCCAFYDYVRIKGDKSYNTDCIAIVKSRTEIQALFLYSNLFLTAMLQ
jgi:hypothetical protein